MFLSKHTKVILLAVCFSFFLWRPGFAQTQKDFRWVDEHFSSVLNDVLPTIEGVGSRLGFRTHQDYRTERLEYSCAFSENFEQKTIIVVVRVPESISIYDQVMALHRRNPQRSIGRIEKALKIKEWRLDERSCPAVRKQYDQFYDFTLPMLSDKDRAERASGVATVVLHPLIYDIEATMAAGDIKLSLYQDEHPFVGWANETKRLLNACIQRDGRL